MVVKRMIIFAFCIMFLFGCGNKESKKEENKEATEIVTEITIKDLNGYNGNSYMDGVESQYAIVGYQGSFTKSISYDSDVIKDIEVDIGDVNTMIEDNYPLSYKIVVDVAAFCEKEGKKNGITGDMLTLTYDSKISIIDKEFAEDMIENGADPENILGYK